MAMRERRADFGDLAEPPFLVSLPSPIESELRDRASFLDMTPLQVIGEILRGALPSRRRLLIQELHVEESAERALADDGLALGLILDWHAGGWKRRPRFLPPPEGSAGLRVFRSRFHLEKEPGEYIVISTYFGEPADRSMTRVAKRPVNGV